jgi:hypothetical protein
MTDNETMESLLIKAEYKIFVARAHNAEREYEEHTDNCFTCSIADEDREMCYYGWNLLQDDIDAWEKVYNHSEWED